MWFGLASALATAQTTQRLALFVGNNEGGPQTTPLLYAVDDARRLRDVFVRLGGVAEADAVLLSNRGGPEVLEALSVLEQKARDAKARGDHSTLFFYYSGHAKDGALRLNDTQLNLEAVKQRLAAGAADTRVAVFDACRSGTLTRNKGVRRAPSFEVESDVTRASKGLVILTSSAADEDSQESDAIGASYFSYHLSTGLLGSADQSGDGRVSLAEAYAYAYERTVASTADSSGGPQHPTFSFDLAGNGDVTLTDVAQRREGLRIPATAPEGLYFVIDTRGVVVAEIIKATAERLIGLPPGRYTVKRRLADRLRLGQVVVDTGAVAVLDESTFKDARFSDDPVKGTQLKSVYGHHWSFGATGTYQAFFDKPTTAGGYFPSAPMVGVEAAYHNLLARGLTLGFDGAYGWADSQLTSGLIQNVAYHYSQLTFGVTGLYEFAPENPLVPFVGVRLGLNMMTREFVDVAAPKQTFSVMTPGVVAGVTWQITRRIGLIARGRVHYLLYNVDETKSLGYAEFGLMLQYSIVE